MNNFGWKKCIEGSINDRLIITTTATGIFFALKAINLNCMDVMGIMKLASKIYGGY